MYLVHEFWERTHVLPAEGARGHPVGFLRLLGLGGWEAFLARVACRGSFLYWEAAFLPGLFNCHGEMTASCCHVKEVRFLWPVCTVVHVPSLSVHGVEEGQAIRPPSLPWCT